MTRIILVYPAQVPGWSVWALSKMGPVFHALPKSKPLRLLGGLQEHWPQSAVSFGPFLGPSCSGDWVAGKALSQVGRGSYVPGRSQPLGLLSLLEGQFAKVPGVSRGALNSGFDPPGLCELCKDPERHE